MKTQRLNPGVLILLLCVISALCTLSLTDVAQILDDPYALASTLWGSILSLILLVGLCLVSARIILWAYSKIDLPQHPWRIYLYGFLVSAVSALISAWMGFLQTQYIMDWIKDELARLSPLPSYIDFFSSGWQPVLLTCAIVSITLLWIARWKKSKDAPAALLSGIYKKQDTTLLLASLVTYVFAIKAMIDFIGISLMLLGFPFLIP